MSEELEQFKAALRKAFTGYVKSEGCSCCQDVPKHREFAREIGALLGYNLYPKEHRIDPDVPEYDLYNPDLD